MNIHLKLPAFLVKSGGIGGSIDNYYTLCVRGGAQDLYSIMLIAHRA